MFSLKLFQEEAISELRKNFLRLWRNSERKIRLVFKSPTGSGKTVMMAQFLRDLTGDPQFDEDKAFLWFSFNEESYEQSKSKLFDYYGGANELELLDLNDLHRGKLNKNNIFFINWQKIKATTKEGRKLRRDNEKGLTFDSFIEKTKADGRDIILIIDEAHRDKETVLADELVNLVDPKIIIEVTATPREEERIKAMAYDKKAGFVEVKIGDVIDAGLIKEKIITQTKEDLEKLESQELDQDLLLLELAYQRKKELESYYQELGKDINPLVLIQLPNDDQATTETSSQTKMDIVKNFLREKEVDDFNISIWLSEKKENLDLIEKNDSPVDFLIFKQAAATGWDCPRADILVMFREIRTPVFHTQTLGRILRMPEAHHYSIAELNIGYLYTNYERNHIVERTNSIGENKPAVYASIRKKEIKPISINSVYMSRTDYNDLGDTFQNTFKDAADSFFEITKNDTSKSKREKISSKIEIQELSIQNDLVVNAEIENYDNFIEKIKDSGNDLAIDSSQNDLERIYNLLCFNVISGQEDEDRKFAPERSWGKIKTALNVYFSNYLEMKRSDYYKVIVKDLLNSDGKLKNILSDAFDKYRPIREDEVRKKAQRSIRTIELEIPPREVSYTDNYKELEVKKAAVEPFYLQEEYLGRINEMSFIKYLEENKSVEWWYKNGDYGSEFFAIPYRNTEKKKNRMFYPDWIVKTNKSLFFLETKAGDTVTSLDTKYKAEALHIWLKDQDKNLIGGIVAKVGNIWKINRGEIYNEDTNASSWEILDNRIK